MTASTVGPAVGAAAGAGAGARMSPLRAVLGAIEDGALTLAAVRARTGLDPAVVDAAVDHLVRAGRLGVSRMLTGCAGRCGDCPVAAGCGDQRPAPVGAGAGPRAGRTLLALWVAPADR